uniref:Lysozyme n=1 Tax=Terrapene triunguis TaxID=2587831 RepID=A0A674JVH9_9SAUR
GLSAARGPTWICLAFYASRFDTGTVTENSDGSSDYGIFQINSRRWCSDQRSQVAASQRLHCSCSLTFLLFPVRMPWRDHCKGQDLSHWVASCNL